MAAEKNPLGGGGSFAFAAPPASSAAAVDGLDPPLLWSHFLALSALPRPSKKEGAVVRWLKAFAEERRERLGLELREDKAGNVLIFRPGSGGGEDAEIVCVQGVSAEDEEEEERARRREETCCSLSLSLFNLEDRGKTLKSKKKFNQKLQPTAHRHGHGEGRGSRARL